MILLTSNLISSDFKGAGEPLSTLQIRQRMLDKMSDTSRIVDRLVKKGWLAKWCAAPIAGWWMLPYLKKESFYLRRWINMKMNGIAFSKTLMKKRLLN